MSQVSLQPGGHVIKFQPVNCELTVVWDVWEILKVRMGTLLSFLHAVTSIEDVMVGTAAPIFNYKEVRHTQGYRELEAWVPSNFSEPPCRHRLPTSGLPLNEMN